MMVEDETCYNEAEAGENSTFTIPIEKLPCGDLGDCGYDGDERAA